MGEFFALKFGNDKSKLMKIRILSALGALSVFSAQLLTLHGASTIDPFNQYAFGANIGWLDWSGGSGQTATGAVIGEYVCSGYIYSANIGWINLGSGLPANRIQYQNNSATDFGVNQDGLGNLSGYAYGANIGWITFEQTYGQPKVNLITGKLSGYVWSANCGWISLSNADGLRADGHDCPAHSTATACPSRGNCRTSDIPALTRMPIPMATA